MQQDQFNVLLEKFNDLYNEVTETKLISASTKTLILVLQDEQKDQWDDIGKVRDIANKNTGSIKAIRAICNERSKSESRGKFSLFAKIGVLLGGGLAGFGYIIYKVMLK